MSLYLMIKAMGSVDPQHRRAAGLVRMAFALLAAGDTAHVGLRVAANLLGGTDTQVVFLGAPMSLVPPQPISLYRNLPLLLQGIGLFALILLSSYRSHDTPFKWIGWKIAISYAFYIPVILFSHRFPLVGMLMIPKTCAYLVVAWFAYRGLSSKSITKSTIRSTSPAPNRKKKEQ